jgi:CheY-like chemotaxis protein
MGERALDILIADDEPDTRLTLQLLLEREGFRVRTAADGHEALKLQKERPADVLITDIFMPDSDGMETIAGFRKEFPQTRIVVVSGAARRSKPDYLETARLVGADLALKKPVDIQELVRALRGFAG